VCGASSRGRKRVAEVMTYQRVEILTGSERRRNYTPAEKVRIVEEAFRPGVIVRTTAIQTLGRPCSRHHHEAGLS
jgi:transposase-like protein